jgi:hypothetical protein
MAAKEKRVSDPALTASRLEILKMKYPNLYPVEFKFGCGEGWYEIIDELSVVLSKEFKALEEGGEVPFIDLMDEHNGRLRVITSDSNASIDNAIKHANSKSTKFCEMCGQQAKILSVNGWVRTLCRRHKLMMEDLTKKRS